MARSDKDSRIKEKATRFCLVNGATPYLEVDVDNLSELEDKPVVITDIDVLGVTVGSSGIAYRQLFDCKSSKKMSPVNRAFWARGLREYVTGAESFVILDRRAESSHRLSAKTLGVHLFNTGLFDQFAESSSIDYLSPRFYQADISNCYYYLEQVRNRKEFASLERLLLQAVPLSNDTRSTFRKILAEMKRVHGEADPTLPIHRAIYIEAVASLSLLFSQMVFDFRTVFDPKEPVESFEKYLRYYVWGGFENYRLRSQIMGYKRSLKGEPTTSEAEFGLPEWRKFLELIRGLTDGPHELARCSLPLREMAIRSVIEADNRLDERLASDFASNSRLKQFTMRISRYLHSAVAWPKDFHDSLDETIESIILSSPAT